MKINNNSAPEILRKNAEKILNDKLSKDNPKMTEVDVLKLIHELEVHQIELEMQNSELEQANELSEVNSQNYKSLYDFAPTGYFTLSNEGKIIELNLNASQILGRERSQLINASFALFVAKDTKSIFTLFLEKVISSMKKESCELTLAINGNDLPVYVLLTAVMSENRKHSLVTMIDITEKKKAENELRESESRFSDMAIHSEGVIYQFYARKDGSTGFYYLSPKAKDIFGFSDDIKSTDWKLGEHVHPDDKESFFNAVNQSIVENKVFIYDTRVVTLFGIKWIHFLSHPIIKGDEVIFNGIMIDITEQKLADQALLENQLLLNRLLIESSKLIDISVESVDYKKLSDTMLEISGANYVCFNVFDDNGLDFTTVALSGIKEIILKATSLLGYEIINKKWKHNPLRAERMNKNLITRYANLSELTVPVISKTVSKIIENTFNVGEIIILNIIQNNLSIGDFTLIYSKGETVRNTELMGLFANQVGLYIKRKSTEESLNKKMDEMTRFHQLVVGRELTMIALKKEVNELLKSSGKEEKYVIVE
jgi:PAS domain S-box-containing protein